MALEIGAIAARQQPQSETRLAQRVRNVAFSRAMR